MSEVEMRQLVAKEAEEKMLEWLLQFTPARELKVADVIQIASWARILVFTAMERVR